MRSHEKIKTPLENAATSLDPAQINAQFPTKALVKFYLVVCSKGLPLLERPTQQTIQSFDPDHSTMACKITKSRFDCCWSCRWTWANHLAQISGSAACEQNGG